jgi:STE24 endopeptidase
VNEDKATRYHRLKRRVSVASLVWSAACLAGVAATGLTHVLRAAATGAASAVGAGAWSDGLTVVVYVLLLSLLNEVGGIPIAYYGGFVLERRYGLSTQPPRTWIVDEVKALAMGLTLGMAAASLLYFFIRLRPDGWWLPAGVVFALCAVLLTHAAPVWLLPLFYSVKPLDHESLRARLLALADRAGARVVGAYEWGLAAKTKKANAALAGLGETRRILVSDTMLSEYSEDEIEVVLAHEMAHHVHGDIWKGLAFESALILAGFAAAARALHASVGPLALQGPADVAGLPVLLLAGGAVSLLAAPAALAMSRAYERSADRFALELTRNPSAFVSAMRRLAAQNLAEEHASRTIQWLFHSHPLIRDRIAAAQAFKG